jgi:hypothetical protein
MLHLFIETCMLLPVNRGGYIQVCGKLKGHGRLIRLIDNILNMFIGIPISEMHIPKLLSEDLEDCRRKNTNNKKDDHCNIE